MRRAAAFGMLLLACLTIADACHATTLKEVKVAIRVLDFLANPPRSPATLGIIYDSQNKDTLADAQSVISWLSSEAASTRTAWQPQLVDVRRLGEAQGLQAGIVVAGMEGAYDQIFDFAKRNGIVTICSDLSCVRTGRCTVGVSSASRVEVILSQRAASSTGVQFSEAFRMMVTEY